jgi:hypothetical protein
MNIYTCDKQAEIDKLIRLVYIYFEINYISL